jgi:hypothetical protein
LIEAIFGQAPRRARLRDAKPFDAKPFDDKAFAT